MSSDGTPASPQAETVGKPAIPDYELIRLIGRGSYGDVWLARGITGVFRAIKIVWRNRFGDSQPFDREFRGLTEFAAISLHETRQLSLLHVGKSDASGFFYYVMELADDAETGRKIDPERYVPCTLSEVRKRRGRVPAAECVQIGADLAQALAWLHERNLVHRDVKPSNVILVGGSPKLADIGLVSAASGSRTFVGTEGFIPPEGPGTPAADVFSLGKILYELATGMDRKEFPSLPGDIETFPDRADFLELNEVVLRACEPDAARRHRSAAVLLGDLQALQAGRSVRRLRRNEWLSGVAFRAAAAIGVLALAAGGAFWLRSSRPPAPRAPAAGEAAAVASPQSIAVLPFTNLSQDAENAFFADGVHEDVINSLARIHDLKVISRTSVMAYKVGARNLRAIASELGVANVLEGSVQRDGNRVRVTAQLVDARVDHPIWAETYDRNVTDAFAIQSDLASEIATALQAKLTTGERRLIARRPTGNPEAYDSYLRARSLDQDLGFYGTREQYGKVIALYQQAIAKDPEFGLAYAQLSLVHSSLYRFSHLDPSPERLASAQASADAAIRLAPELPEAKIALGVIKYLGSGDWEGALADFRNAEADLPNDDQLQWWMGNALRRLGRWDEAIGYFESSSVLNPRAPGAGITAIQTMRYLRRFAKARAVAESYLARFPDNPEIQEDLARVEFEIDGDRAAYLHRMDALASDPLEPTGLVYKYEAAVRSSDWNAADRVLSDPRMPGIPELPHFVDAPVPLHQAMVAFFAGNREKSALLAERAAAYYQKGRWNQRQMPWMLMGRARAEAFSGHGDEAAADARAAWASAVRSDATSALAMRPLLAQVFLILDRRDEALGILRAMTTEPSDQGPQALRWDPWWRKIKDDPRFEKILSSAKPL